MRNNLPKRCNKQECGVINLDRSSGPGTHWVSYYKHKKICFYFDSFGDLQPLPELTKYVGKDCLIHFNYEQFQKFDSIICGHLCLKFLFIISFNLN